MERGLRKPVIEIWQGGAFLLYLIGGSGMMNGLVECETPHIVKGRIVKKCSSEVDEQTNDKGQVISAEVREVTSNKMIFNVLTQSGFRSLT